MKLESHATTEVIVRAAGARLAGILTIPERAAGLVIFAHGSGSSRLSPRNTRVARMLNDGSLATLLFDLLTLEEEVIDEATAEFRFDIGLLTRRLMGAIDWAGSHQPTGRLRVGLFGASTGAAAALIAAARMPGAVDAVVSRGGRVDLAGDYLPRVKAPTLLIVGGRDAGVIELNAAARARMTTKVSLEIVPGAGHLFDRPGELEQVAGLACRWFTDRLGGQAETLPDPSSQDEEDPDCG